MASSRMVYSIGSVLSVSGETQPQLRHDSSPRRRRLYELIVSGFEHLLSQQGHKRIDGRGSGYVVWVPRREQYGQQQQQVYLGNAEGEEGGGGSPLVLYGGGYDGLFSGGLEQALDCCDCLSPPLRWVKLPLELLPPPASAPSRGSSAASAKEATSRSSSESREGPERFAGPSPARGGQHEGKKKKFGFVGVAPEPEGGWGAGRKRPGVGGRNGGDGGRERGVGAPAGSAGAFVGGTCEQQQGGDEGDRKPRGKGAAENGIVGKGNAGGRHGPREMVDLWWLTDPPAPKVSAEAQRLRVATETVQTPLTDAEDAPGVVCTIEVCEGRPYLPGRLQRYPNVATSTGPYRAVYSYRVLSSGPRSAHDVLSPGGGGSTGESNGFGFAPPSPGAQSPWCRSGRDRGDEGLAWVSVIDVKPSRWYNVRHRFTWRVGGSSDLDGIEEVVTVSRHVHTEPFFPPVTAPPKPYAIVGCSRRREHQQHKQQKRQQKQQTGSRRTSREQGGRWDDEGLVFHFRLRWGPRAPGARRNGGRCFARAEGAQDNIEYIVQESMLQSRSGIGSAASAQKGKASSPTSGVGEVDLGVASPNNLRSTGPRTPKQGATGEELHAQHNATWSSGDPGSCGAAAAVAPYEGDDPFFEQLFGDGSKPEIAGGERNGESGWGAWRTVCRTRGTRETVEFPHAESLSRPTTLSSLLPFRGASSVPMGLRYRVGARRRDGPHNAKFSDALEVPVALLTRLYDIEEISATRRPLVATSASKQRTAGGTRSEPSTLEARQDGAGRERGLEDEEAKNFLTAFELSENGHSFPARVAWELQSEFWPQQGAEEQATSPPAEDAEEARVKTEARRIQRTLVFPVNTEFIAGIIREIDATAGG